MFFNSLEFFFFFAVVWLLYLALPHKAQNRMLLLASYVFYGAWNVKFLSLIMLSTVVDFQVGRALGASNDPRRRKQLVTLSIVFNLGMLAFFRYMSFFAEPLGELLGSMGVTLNPIFYDILLPAGISFYTFQTMSYSLDVYRRHLEPTERFFDFALFVAFFPQLVAGPIERATRLLPQILKPRKVNWDQIGSGAWLIMRGTFKKVVIADNLAHIVQAVYAEGAQVTAWEVVVGTWAFAWQLYGDFSGYSDVARGASRMMGIELMLNFNLPFLATSPRNYWRRWHISLSTWLRDYVYIPLGGNRGGEFKTYRNLAITLILAGIWHGPSMNKFLFGLVMALAICAHRAAEPFMKPWVPARRSGQALWWAARVFVNFQFFTLCWIVFVPDSLELSLNLYSVLLHGPWEVGLAGQWMIPLTLLVLPMMLMHGLQVWSRDLECVLRWPPLVRAATYASVFLTIVFFGEDFGLPFFYFQF
ncbi:MAG: alginate O-acetyltransferase complex protein AlgI [Pseudohongiellaceae bacterium]